MKTITLLPVKDEAWILPYSLKNFSDFSDHIIIADQHSTDGSREIYKNFPKVTVIDNNLQGHTTKVRALLLEEARKIPGNNLIVCLDADELLSPHAIVEIRKKIGETKKSFTAAWVQLIDDGSMYRVDGVWKTNRKSFAFVDDGQFSYPTQNIVDDHNGRIPTVGDNVVISYPILHLHYMAKSRSEIKQAWYMCTERILGFHPYRINNRYNPAKLSHIKSEKINLAWISDVDMPAIEIFSSTDKRRVQTVLDLFKKHGIAFFEPLDIWHIHDLREKFVEEVGRQPKPSIAPKWLLSLNAIKNNIKKYD